MKLNELDKKLKKLKIDEESKDAFLELMDLKIESDMDKVLNAIGALNSKLDHSIGALRDGILSNRSEMKTSFDSSRNEMKTSISSLRWTVITVCTVTAAIVGLIVKFIK